MMKRINKELISTCISEDEISLYITCASFEERSLVLPELITGTSLSGSLVFYNSNENKAIQKNAKKIKNWLGETSKIIELNSDEPIYNYQKVREGLKSLKNFQGTNILIDITTFTHETLLVLVKLITLNRSLFKKVYFSYLGASEYGTDEKDDENKWLSKGIKEIRTVLGYSGITDPLFNDHLMILFGFEFDRTRELIEQYEFKYVTLGFANLDESIQTNHWRINVERHKQILSEYPNSFEFNFSLLDHYSTKESILNYLKKDIFRETNTVIAPLNNKISTIGAGLAAIENEDIQLTYAKALIYNVQGYSKPSDMVHYGILI